MLFGLLHGKVAEVASKRESWASTYPTTKKMVRYYVVFIGHNPGIYRTWEECRQQVHRFKNAIFISTTSYEEVVMRFENFQRREPPIPHNNVDADVDVRCGCEAVFPYLITFVVMYFAAYLLQRM
eukprot:TRINITY_DN16439_c0_g3_i1.p1 TRINITY_DN16439_c0_g3~~TRINITY_DN16439_c0_g3_i1.p1  ORF type:complete len:125 (-),score=7.11 TRINITY_DN16439_c0_g3_i1:163-537(-)